MTQSFEKQKLLATMTPDRSPGCWKLRLVSAVIAALWVTTSSTAWADTQSFDLSDFDGISADEGIHLQVTIGEVFEVTAESKDARQLKYLKLDVRRGFFRAQMNDTLLSPDWVSGDKVTIRVVMPSLIKAKAHAGADFVTRPKNKRWAADPSFISRTEST